MTFAALIFILGILIAFGSFALDAISIALVAYSFLKGKGNVPAGFILRFVGGMLGMIVGMLIAMAGAAMGGWVFVQTYILPQLR